MAGSTARITIRERREREKRRRNLVSVAAFSILVAAWLIGFLGRGSALDVDAFIGEVLPEANHIERSGDLFIGYASEDASGEIVGYAMTGSATGYSGPLIMLVGTDSAGAITGVTVVEHGETPNFFNQLERAGFYEQFTGADYSESLLLGEGVDGVSGATLSAEAVALSIHQAVRGIASQAIDGAQLPPDTRPIQFGAPEVTLLSLFVISFFLHRLKKRPTLKRYGRWAILVSGLILLGFVFNKPFTLSNVITLLSGYWPDWHTNLYWFLLVGGIIVVTSIQGKNPYCSWFCPFGAAQEILGSISGAKPYQPRALYNRLRWVQRSLAFTAIVLGLALRQPGAASFEPFGTLFDLQGSWPQWVLLVLVLFGSLVIYRPFCNYICPLDPVVDYIGEVRRFARNTWRQRIKPRLSTSESPS